MRMLAVLLVGVALLMGVPVAAQSASDAQEAMRETARFPWYDQQADGVKPVRLKSESSPPSISNWQWPAIKRRNWNFNLGPVIGDILQVLAWLLLIAVLVVTAVLVVRAYLESEGFGFGKQGIGAADDGGRTDAERIENLPFEVKMAQTDLLAEAKRLRSSGRYGEAVVYLFSYMLVQLDKQHLIRLTKGKTNRQYLREISPRGDIRRVFQPTMVAFEDFFFGDHAIEPARCDALWGGLDEFHGMLGTQPLAASS